VRRYEDGPAHVRGWIEVSESGAALVLRIGGELDAASRKSIEPEVRAATESAASVVIDLEALTFCDSSGVAMFIAAHESAKACATTLGIRHVRPPVRRVFEIAHLDSLIELIE
jgi:anti-sigma B factor antagonist